MSKKANVLVTIEVPLEWEEYDQPITDDELKQIAFEDAYMGRLVEAHIERLEDGTRW
jgi:D-arabinose 5-phosphate isomerase GutQ